MTPQDDNKSVRNFRTRYLSGIKTSVLNNAVAYGYSVTITGAFEILNVTEGSLRACLVKVRVKPLGILVRAEDPRLRALFGGNPSKMKKLPSKSSSQGAI